MQRYEKVHSNLETSLKKQKQHHQLDIFVKLAPSQ